MIRQTIAAVLLTAMAGAGCTFSPVYSDGSPINAMSLAFDLGSPTTRLEQIVYNELSLRFATSSAPKTPKLTVSVSASHRSKFVGAAPSTVRNGVNLGSSETYEVTVDVTAVVSLAGDELLRVTRRAVAPYSRDIFNTTRGNYTSVLSEKTAAEAAEQTAALAATESLRLTLLAKFPYNASYLNPAN